MKFNQTREFIANTNVAFIERKLPIRNVSNVRYVIAMYSLPQDISPYKLYLRYSRGCVVMISWKMKNSNVS